MFKLHSLWFKLFGAGALVIIISAALVAGIGYHQTKRTIIQEAKKHVFIIAHERRARVEAWLAGVRRATQAAAYSGIVTDLVTNSHAGNGKGPRTRVLPPARIFRDSQEKAFLQQVAVFDSKKQLLASYGIEDGFPPDTTGIELQSALAGKGAFSAIHLNSQTVPVINISVPAYNRFGEIGGAMFVSFSTASTINSVLADTSGLGMSGEAFMVDRDTLMITPSRFMNHPVHLTHKMPIPSVLAGLNGETGSMIYNGFLGNDVVGAYTALPEHGWVIVVEMRLDEAFKPLHTIITRTLLAISLALFGLLLLTSMMAQVLTSPLERLVAASKEVGKGDFSIRLQDTFRKDEIGTLIRMFNNMVKNLADSQEQLKTSHHRLLQSEKLAAIGALVAGIVHEMRNPLSAVKINLRMLERKLPLAGHEAEHVNIASQEVLRLERMFAEILDYSKPPELHPTVIDPVKLVKKAMASVQETAESKGIHLDLEVIGMGEKEQLLCDEEIIRRVLVNLVENGIDASKEGGTVTIKVTYNDKEEIVFEVADHGSGMSEKIRQRIFDPFYTTREDGIGLGMNNVKKFVEAHFGVLEVESREGEGTIVRVILSSGVENGENSGN